MTKVTIVLAFSLLFAACAGEADVGAYDAEGGLPFDGMQFGDGLSMDMPSPRDVPSPPSDGPSPPSDGPSPPSDGPSPPSDGPSIDAPSLPSDGPSIDAPPKDSGPSWWVNGVATCPELQACVNQPPDCSALLQMCVDAGQSHRATQRRQDRTASL
ncbi:MAG: hypothetical protein JRH20_30350 [Deltaproteobacteria bacterium]|nr:hypothetical protein [Deltaproteobacteria bacterium]